MLVNISPEEQTFAQKLDKLFITHSSWRASKLKFHNVDWVPYKSIACIYGPIIKRFGINSVLEIGCQHQHDARIWIDIIPTITTVDWVLWHPINSIAYLNRQTNQWEKQQQRRVNIIKNDCCDAMFTSTLDRHDLIIHNCAYVTRLPTNVDLPRLPSYEQETIQIFNNLISLCNVAYVIENIPSIDHAHALLKLIDKQQFSTTTIYTTPLLSSDKNLYHTLIFIKTNSIIDNEYSNITQIP